MIMKKVKANQSRSAIKNLPSQQLIQRIQLRIFKILQVGLCDVWSQVQIMSPRQ